MQFQCPSCKRTFEETGFCPFDRTQLVDPTSAGTIIPLTPSDQQTILSMAMKAQPAPDSTNPPTSEMRRETFPLTPTPKANQVTQEVTAARAREARFRSAFVVGGDAKDTGTFHDGLALLRAIHENGNPFESIGVPSYPEGHVSIDDDVLLRVLLDKQPLAAFTSTQMCFNPGAVAEWVTRIRAAGVTLPIHLGTPGVADLTKLMSIAAKIGEN